MKLKSSAGVTFRVHNVDKSNQVLTLCKTRDSIDRILRCVLQRDEEPVLACSGYNSNVKSETNSNAFFEAIHTAFALHLPLILSPDMIWITILQGLAMHVHLHHEKLRSVLVKHIGRKELPIVMDIDPSSPESEWDEVINAFALKLCSDTTFGSELLSDFSTTSPVDKLVSQVCLLDVFESYYEYILLSGCGFPEITLTGTADDWAKLRQKIELLERYQMDFWLPHLRRVTDIFCDASRGNIDVDLWKGMYKLPNRYGATFINGWIVKLIPYVKNLASGTWTEINPLLLEGPEYEPHREIGVSSDTLPAGMSVVPFRCIDIINGAEQKMEMIGGFVGVEQNENTGAVQPKIGWAVRPMREKGWSCLSAPTIFRKRKAVTADVLSAKCENLLRKNRCMNMPGEFLEFYKECNGFQLTEANGLIWKVFPLSKVEGVFLAEGYSSPKLEPSSKLGSSSELEEQSLESEYSSAHIFVGNHCYLRIGSNSQAQKVFLNTSFKRGEKRLIFEVEVRDANDQLSATYAGLQDFINHLTSSSVS
ncbi:MAG TPA: DUF4419 domain-containing protein [Drouetiella sp.]|jgi:Domain of unknown function (DUF4419)